MTSIDFNSARRNGSPIATRTLTLVVGIITTSIIFIVNFNFIVVHFYKVGAYLFDSGMAADVLWRNPHILPRWANLFGGETFDAVHFSPYYDLANGISFLSSLRRVEFYAVFQGVVYASMTCVMFMFLTAILVDKRASTVIGAGLVALLFGFNGYSLTAISYPHPEMLWPAMAFGFLWALFAGRLRMALMFFVLALLVREDAGVHLFGFITVSVAADLLAGRSLQSQRNSILFAIAAFAYTIAAVLIMKLVYHGGGLFAQEFLGDPPYGHLTWAYIPTRFWQFLKTSPWVPLTAIVALIFAVFDRQPRYLLGYVATAPWILLYVCALPEYVLGGYRTFPMALAMVWPVLEMSRQHKFRMPIKAWLWCCLFIILTCFASMIVFKGTAKNYLEGFRGFTPRHDNFDALVRFLDSAQLNQNYGVVILDHSIIALSPRNIERKNALYEPPEKVDTFIYWENSHFLGPANAKLVQDQSFEFGYRLKGTNVLVASRSELLKDQLLGPYLEKDCAANDTFPTAFRLANWVSVNNCMVIVPAHPDGGAVIFGPYFSMAPGHYKVRFQFAIPDPTARVDVGVDVATNSGLMILAERTVTLENRKNISPIELAFEIPNSDLGNNIEFRVWSRGEGFVVENISFHPN